MNALSMSRSNKVLGLLLACLGATLGCDTGSKTVVQAPPPAPTVKTVVVQAPSVPAALAQQSTTTRPPDQTSAGTSSPTPAPAPAPTPTPAPTSPNTTDPSATVTVPVPPPLPLPVADVVQLTRSGIDEGVVIEYIANIREPFAFGASQIVYLNDLGASSNVIHGLMRKSAALQAEGATANPPVPPPPSAAAPVIPADGPGAGAPPPTGAVPQPTAQGTPPPPGSVTTTVVPAPASPTVINQQVFYQSLSPYGSWVEVPGYGWCWRPTVAVANVGWQPYCDGGSWLWTDAGWYWNSTYTWGWAPFHYGRWHQHARFGWVWYPGYDWAPAWVAWRSSPANCGWAPLPPECRWNASVGFSWVNGNTAVSIGFGIGATAWYATTWDRFCDPHLYHHRLPRHQVERFVQESKVQIAGNQNVNIRGNNNTVIINNGITRDEVQRHTRDEIRRTDLREVNSPAAAQSFASSRPNPSGGRPAEVAVYRPTVPVHDSRPPESVLKRQQEASAVRPAPIRTPGGQADRIGIEPLTARPLPLATGGGSLNPSRPATVPAAGLAPSQSPQRPASTPAATPMERMTQTLPPPTRPGNTVPTAAAPRIQPPPAVTTPANPNPSRPPETRSAPIPRSQSGATPPGANLVPGTTPSSGIPVVGSGATVRPAPIPVPRTSPLPPASAPGVPSTPPAPSRSEAIRTAPAPTISLPPSAIQSRPGFSSPAPAAPIPAAPAPAFVPAPRPVPTPIPMASPSPSAPAFQPSPRPSPAAPSAPSAPAFQPSPRPAPAPSASPAPGHAPSGRPGQRGPVDR